MQTNSTNNPIDQLIQIIGDVDSFLAEWSSKLETDVASLSDSSIDSRLRQRMQQFAFEKKAWEQRRNRELLEINERADHLTQAWMRLESEQRQFLRTKHSQQPPRTNYRTPVTTESESSTPVSTMTDEPNQDADDVPQTAQPRAESPRSRSSLSALAGFRAGVRSTEKAVQQFQLLQREISLRRPSINRS